MPGQAPVLEVTNLSTQFRDKHRWKTVIEDIHFCVYPGETLAIVGESGSGKSVTSLSIMRLLNPRQSRISGSIKLAGQELTTLSDKAMRQIRANDIAMIFQEPMTSLNPAFTVGEQIAELLKVHQHCSHKEAREQTIELLNKVRIPNAQQRFDEYPHQFSGGMRQRVMIAMALALKPKLLIADEPTTALDVTIQGQILDLIKTLQQEEGMAVLFITHDMGVVAEVADRTLVMFRGHQVEENTTEKLFAEPEQYYTRMLLNAVPKLGEVADSHEPIKFPQLEEQSGEPIHYAPQPALLEGQLPLLEVKNLTTRFPIHGGFWSRQTAAVHAVEDISFCVYPGETLSFVGESGCGKSTTGRSLMRLVEPDSGYVEFNGYDVRSLNKADLRKMRRDIQFIFQDPFASLNPRMTVEETLIEPLLEHGLATKSEAKKKAADLIEQVGLSVDMLRRYPHEFSGGQRQRIAIARALTLDPKLIIADESVSALDVSVKAQVVNLLMDLQQQRNLAYLFISHDMAVVERISHRVAVMYLGEIVEIGPRQAVFNSPQHPYTKKLLQAVPVADPKRRHLKREQEISELKSPIRDLDYVAPKRHYQQVGEDHWVMASAS
ncbi:dipeptide ABC transporter ATP-binding protein [Vibrio sp. CAIM 722]|uniref:Glutathione import ATP-binding protein GsiA n=1 Tax=Vibrio eleionomae TaxID=2653505 RepID=A0A7X4LJG4_9VIBR|nr:ABC transporter ATP-binding protein [Vibrio eleionomae]MZI93049.1 dipeptide ABC transporter ATP-binding protein [Vibrio eleionomae]